MKIDIEITKMKIIEILALFKAIKNTAKKYHWKTVGSDFMGDHLLFDRIYDDISDDLVDAVVEKYFMGVGRKNIDDVDNLCLMAAQMEGESLPATTESLPLMYQQLANMMNQFITQIEKIQAIRGINSDLDSMAATITQLYGLVMARLA